MNNNGITTDIRTINCIVENGIEHVSIDLIESRNVDNYVQLLYTYPNTPIGICDEKTFELLKCRLEFEHQESKFRFYHWDNIPYVTYLKDDDLEFTAKMIDFFINQLFDNPEKLIEIQFKTEKENQILFARIFQRLRNEHSDIVHMFLPKFKDEKYFICWNEIQTK